MSQFDSKIMFMPAHEEVRKVLIISRIVEEEINDTLAEETKETKSTTALPLTKALVEVLKERINRLEDELLSNTGMSTRGFFTLVEEKETLEKEILDMETKLYSHAKEEWISNEIKETMYDIRAAEKEKEIEPNNEFLSFRLARLEAKLMNLITA